MSFSEEKGAQVGRWRVFSRLNSEQLEDSYREGVPHLSSRGVRWTRKREREEG